MNYVKLGLGLAFVFCAHVSAAAPLKLEPADPQPTNLKPGLSVRYAYPADVKNLKAAENALRYKVEQGTPISGLDHRDTNVGQKVMTSKRAERVVADINGFVHFDTPGQFTIDFLTNDGLRAQVGGQVVGEFDGRQPCEETFAVDVEVPKAGWYPLKALYFQRTNTACLHMRMGPAGKRAKWMPDSAFGH